jgi:hypothetical protein
MEYLRGMQRALDGMGWGNAGEWMKWAIAASGGALMLTVLFCRGEWALVFGVLSLLPVVAAYVVPSYFWASRQRQLEEELAQALHRAASNAFLPADALLAELSAGDTVLAREFRKASMQVRNGVPVDDALEEMAASNDSRMLSMALGLLVQCYRTGADMALAFRETADEISGLASVMRQQAINTTIEKYTLLLAGGVIVPLVLGALGAMVGSLSFAGLAELGFGAADQNALLANALLGSEIYIAEYAVIASVFVAYQESSLEKAVVYMAVLVPLSLALFMLARAVVAV